jgi:hypothetical protein
MKNVLLKIKTNYCTSNLCNYFELNHTEICIEISTFDLNVFCSLVTILKVEITFQNIFTELATDLHKVQTKSS